MNIDVQLLPGSSNVTSVTIDGRIDAYTVDRVEEELTSLIRIGSFNLVCDLSDVEFISSAGFKAFRRIINFAREHEGELKFFGLSPELMLLFHSVGFAKVTGIFATQNEAVADFRASSSAPKNESGLKSKISGLLSSVGLTGEDADQIDQSPQTDAALQQTQILPSKASYEDTVILPRNESGNDNSESGPFARIEPVRVTLHPEQKSFQHLSQLLGTIGSLVGFSSMDLVKLNRAVVELCRTMIDELEPDETFLVEIDSHEPGFTIHVDVPRKEFCIYQCIKPHSAEKALSREEGKDWLLKYVDELNSSSEGDTTRYTLSLND